MKKMLIVYYSLSNGNTERIAEMLKQETGADIARIETEKPYTGSYDEIVEQGQREVRAKFEPTILPLSENVADYDVIAVGSPTWWYTMAPAVRSFLKNADLAGKTVVPFTTNGGYPGKEIEDMSALCVGATIAFPMRVRFDSTGGDKLETPVEKVEEWARRVAQSL